MLGTRLPSFLHLFIFVWVYVGEVLAWRSEDNLVELSLSFYHVGPGDKTRRLGGRCLYLMSHLTSPTSFIPLLCFISA